MSRGADLSVFSQYPHEAEVTFPPLTALEVMGKRIKEDVVVIELRPFVSSEGMNVRRRETRTLPCPSPRASELLIVRAAALRAASWLTLCWTDSFFRGPALAQATFAQDLLGQAKEEEARAAARLGLPAATMAMAAVPSIP